MKTIWIGIAVFIGWAIFSNYWYVCKIRNLCGDEVTSVIEMNESHTMTDTIAEMGATEEDEKEENALVRSIEQTVIYFTFDSSYVINEDELQKLTQDVNTLSPELLILEGHCCDIGTESYNMDLGQRRANRVKRALIEQGIARNAISTVSYGEKEPAVPNTSENNRKQNRRVEIIIKEK